DEPTSACIEPFTVRSGRWMRRHKPLVAAAAALLLTAAIASTTGLVLFGKKNVEIAAKKQEAETARLLESEQRLEAEANFRKARAAVDTFLTKAGDERLRDVPRMEKARRELLEQAVAFNQGFLNQRGDDPEIQLELALTQGRLAKIYRQLGQEVEQ